MFHVFTSPVRLHNGVWTSDSAARGSPFRTFSHTTVRGERMRYEESETYNLVPKVKVGEGGGSCNLWVRRHAFVCLVSHSGRSDFIWLALTSMRGRCTQNPMNDGEGRRRSRRIAPPPFPISLLSPSDGESRVKERIARSLFLPPLPSSLRRPHPAHSLGEREGEEGSTVIHISTSHP